MLVHGNAFGPSDAEPEKGHCLTDVKDETAYGEECEPPSRAKGPDRHAGEALKIALARAPATAAFAPPAATLGELRDWNHQEAEEVRRDDNDFQTERVVVQFPAPLCGRVKGGEPVLGAVGFADGALEL